MPFLFIVLGVVMVTAAARDTVSDYKDASGNKQPGLATLVVNDFTGPNNFIYWFIAIMLIGAIGYIKPLQPISRGFLVLVAVTLLIQNSGVFEQFTKAIQGTQSTTRTVN